MCSADSPEAHGYFDQIMELIYFYGVDIKKIGRKRGCEWQHMILKQ